MIKIDLNQCYDASSNHSTSYHSTEMERETRRNAEIYICFYDRLQLCVLVFRTSLLYWLCKHSIKHFDDSIKNTYTAPLNLMSNCDFPLFDSLLNTNIRQYADAANWSNVVFPHSRPTSASPTLENYKLYPIRLIFHVI